MVAAWTFFHYVGQEDRSPTYRFSVLSSFGYAVWTTLVEGSGPLVCFLVIAFHGFRAFQDQFIWACPLLGGTLYALLVAALSRIGRSWPASVHILIGVGWLLTGAVVLTRLTQK
jgi:hypothetical protein